MSEPSQPPPELVFRPGNQADWPVIAQIVTETWADGDYITEQVWADWLAHDEAQLVVGVSGDRVIAFARLSELGPAEYWLEGMRVDPAQRGQGVGRAVLAHMVTLFKQQGIGLLRFITSGQNEAMAKIARELGFRHTVSYGEVQADAQALDYRGFKLLQPPNMEMAHKYLRNSPMYRVNRFAFREWALYYLTQERLAQYLANPQIQVLGWRQFDQLLGLAIVFSVSPQESGGSMHVAYVDAPDDTSLAAMLAALRGLAAKHGFAHISWHMPLGVGLERPVSASGLERTTDEELWLFELPLRV